MVTFRWRGRAPAAAGAACSRAVRRVFALHGRGARGEVNLIWSDRRRLRRLNRRFRGTDRFTDVIAFRYAPGPETPGGAPDLPFGDVHIAGDQARANARRFFVPVREELVRVAVHGALHLLGFTDGAPAERRRMWAAQEPIVRWATLSPPSRP